VNGIEAEAGIIATYVWVWRNSLETAVVVV
jgi:hypothetical protein